MMGEERTFILEWLEDTIGVHYVADNGSHREAVATCPACGREKKLWVNLQSGAWTCYYCTRSGPAEAPLVPLYQLIHDCSKVEARQALLQMRGPRRGSASSTPIVRVEKAEWKGFLPDEYRPVYSEDGWDVPSYLLERGISALTARQYELGYCSTGSYAGRVILPIIIRDQVMGFQGRAVDKWREPKYDQPAGMPKSLMVFGFDHIKPGSEVLIVEGAFDVLGVREAGFDAVAGFGKSLSARQVELVLELKPRRVVVLTDPAEQDPTAPHLATRTCDALWNKGFREVGLAISPKGQDPAELGVDSPAVLSELVSEAKWPTEAQRRHYFSLYKRKMDELRDRALAKRAPRR